MFLLKLGDGLPNRMQFIHLRTATWAWLPPTSHHSVRPGHAQCGCSNLDPGSTCTAGSRPSSTDLLRGQWARGWAEPQPGGEAVGSFMMKAFRHFSLPCGIGSLVDEEMADSIQTFSPGPCQKNQRLHMRNLYHLKTRCSNTAKETSSIEEEQVVPWGR